MAEKKKRKKGPNLSVGRGEKRPASKGAGLTAKGRAKYNRETGSNLNPPVTGKPKNKKEALSQKISKLRKEGKKPKQAVAIAFNMTKKKDKKGGY